MRKILLSVAGLAALTAVAGCADAGRGGGLNTDVRVNIFADTETRTAIEYDPESGLYIPVWSPGDRIGLYTSHGHSNIECTARLHEENGRCATFTGVMERVIPGEHTFYAYYPYNSASGADKCSAIVEIASSQTPLPTSFDGTSDILLSDPVTADIDTDEISLTLRYKRLSSVIKLDIECTLNSLDLSQSLRKVTFEVPGAAFAGSRTLDIETGMLGDFTDDPHNAIEAVCSEGTVLGDATIWMLAYPETVKAGSAVKFTLETDTHLIVKEIETGVDIDFTQGGITSLRLGLAEDDPRVSVTPKEIRYDLYYAYNGEVLNDNGSSVYGTYSKTLSGVDWHVSYGANQASHPTNPGLWAGSNNNENTNIPRTVLAGEIFGPIGAALGIAPTTTRVAALLETTPMPSISKIEFCCSQVNEPEFSTVSLVYSDDGGTTYRQIGIPVRLSPVPRDTPIEFVFDEPIPSAIYSLVFRSSQTGATQYVQVRVPTIKFYSK